MKDKVVKIIQQLEFSLILFLLLGAYFLEYYLYLEPCPLCIMQRVCLFVMFFMSILAVFTRFNKLPLVIIRLFFSIFGLYFSLRQVYLQGMPIDDSGMCLPAFSVLVKYLSFTDMLSTLFLGSSHCARISWEFLGVSIPGWTSIAFVLLLLSQLTVIILLKQNVKK